MRLSEKGSIHLNEWTVHKLPVDAFEFKPEDFTGAVVLTVEEACEILDYLSYLHLRGGKDSFLNELENCNRNLYERIEQSEKNK